MLEPMSNTEAKELAVSSGLVAKGVGITQKDIHIRAARQAMQQR
jgi:hypothetical protein